MEGRVFENFQFFFSKFQKCPKLFPKVSKRVLNVFWGKFFESFFCPVFRGRSSFRKFSKKNVFKITKMPKSVPKSIQTCFEQVLGKIFRKILCPVFHGGSSLRKFLTNQKILKIQKCPKSFPKVSKHDLNIFWGKLFEKFLPSFPWNVEFLKIFNFFFQNSKNAQNRSQKYPNVF